MFYSLEYLENKDLIVSESEGYYVIHYKKQHDSKFDNYRSVVFNYRKELVAFSSPMTKKHGFSRDTNFAQAKFCRPSENLQYVSEFIHGPMINLFYDFALKRWEIATKCSVGGYHTGKNGGKTFRELFIEKLGIFDPTTEKDLLSIPLLKNLDKTNSYQFIDNADKLYLVAIYKINNNKARFIHPTQYQKWKCFGSYNKPVHFPREFRPNNGNKPKKMSNGIFDSTTENFEKPSFSNSFEHYCSLHSDPRIAGIVITDMTTGESAKYMNAHYLEKRRLQKIHHNLFYHYVCFRRMDKLVEMERFFPQLKMEMAEYDRHYDNFVKGIYLTHRDYYVNKTITIMSARYAHHASLIHSLYKGIGVTLERTYDYVKEVHPDIIIESVMA